MSLLSQEGVRDVCSLLNLADRVLVASPAADAVTARLLVVCLEELGFLAEVVDARSIHRVQRHDTVAVICGADSDPALIDLVWPAVQVQAVLLAVTASTHSALRGVADAVIAIPPSGTPACSAGAGSSRPGVDLGLFVAVDAIRADLDRRRRARP